MSYTEPIDRREQLRVKLKSLALESSVIRVEEHRARFTRKGAKRGDPWKYAALRDHRVGTVRHEARLTHLVYGALRGLPYEKMESGFVRTPLTVDDRRQMLKMWVRYGAAGTAAPSWMQPPEVKLVKRVVTA